MKCSGGKFLFEMNNIILSVIFYDIILQNRFLKYEGVYIMGSTHNGRTIKKLSTGVIISVLSLTVCGLSTTVFASETAVNEPAYKITSLNDESQDLTKLLTPEELDVAQNDPSSELFYYYKAIENSKSAISDLEDHNKSINKDVALLTKDFTPEEIAEAKEDLKKKEEALDTAQKKLDNLSENNSSELDRSKAQAEVDSAKNLYDDASYLVNYIMALDKSTKATIVERYEVMLKANRELIEKYRTDIKNGIVKLLSIKNASKGKSNSQDNLKESQNGENINSNIGEGSKENNTTQENDTTQESVTDSVKTTSATIQKKVESSRQLPNTGTEESGLLVLFGTIIGLLAIVGKRKYR